MTEVEWLVSKDPQRMLEFLGGKASDRKLRLFGVACCRRIWKLLPNNRCRTAVQAAEAFADGMIGVEKLRKAERVGEYYGYDEPQDLPEERLLYHIGGAIFQLCQDRIATRVVAHASADAVSYSALAAGVDRFFANDAKDDESAAQSRLICCIFGNPFRPITIVQSSLTSTARSLAQAIYDDRAFDRLPILADALEDAGCTDQDILNHCRQPGEHVRGCWVVDLLLGKT
jgi:hypothetical protein